MSKLEDPIETEITDELAARDYRERDDAPRRMVPRMPPEAGAGASLGDVLEGILASVGKHDAERRRLPCVKAMYPAGPPDEYMNLSPSHSLLAAGARACSAAHAEAKCSYASVLSFCPQRRAAAIYDQASANLSAGQVEQEETRVILAHLRRKDPRPLLDTDALRAVRGFLAGRKAAVALEDGAEVEPLHGGPGALERGVQFLGGERLMVLAGNTGRGKTLAACYAIARLGGRYVTEYPLADPRACGLEAIKRAGGVLVVDQVGRATPRAAVTLEEIVDARYASGARTILLYNGGWQHFAARYQAIVLERVAGAGVFVLLGGDSLRPLMRQERAQ